MNPYEKEFNQVLEDMFDNVEWHKTRTLNTKI
jgi:hypothetical protein